MHSSGTPFYWDVPAWTSTWATAVKTQNGAWRRETRIEKRKRLYSSGKRVVKANHKEQIASWKPDAMARVSSLAVVVAVYQNKIIKDEYIRHENTIVHFQNPSFQVMSACFSIKQMPTPWPKKRYKLRERKLNGCLNLIRTLSNRDCGKTSMRENPSLISMDG